jgi:hypothetical protein
MILQELLLLMTSVRIAGLEDYRYGHLLMSLLAEDDEH